MKNDLNREESGAGMEAASHQRPRKGDDQKKERPGDRPVLVTGGAGFIGTNLVARLAAQGRRTIIFDNLSRPGVEENLHWLRRNFGDLITAEIADIRDPGAVRRAVARAGAVYHLAAQVAVTTSVVDPEGDFDVNARGTLNVLEAIRNQSDPPPLVFTSTNKVYGKLDGQEVVEQDTAYSPEDPETAALGIDESQPLDFYSPYGCSKGTADQYVRDYSRIYGLPTVVFRMSCIYGPHQRGTEDQGWVAHFLLRTLAGETITLYGNGKQVRDILFVDDLVEALLLAPAKMETLRGGIFNIGGGPRRTVSLLDLLTLIERVHGRAPEVSFGAWRPGDQPYYVSNTGRFHGLTGWDPQVGVAEGVGRLYDWLRDQLSTPATERAEAALP